MAGINARINLIDSLSAPMQRMIVTTEGLINHMNNIEGAMNDSFNTSVIEEARHQAEVLANQMNTVSSNINNAESEQQNFDNSIQQSANSMDGLVGKVKGMLAAYLSINAIVGSAKRFMKAANVQIEAETKLGTVMRQRMGATDDMIQSVKNLASEQQNLGVIGDEVQMAGAQQLSTFLSTTDALKTLMPAMNNLAAQQNGVNASSGDMVNIGNLMGKVMQGQVGALTRAGVTFSDAQEKVLKYGTEQERAAMLAQVITDNVGNMNAELAKTPAGQMAQVSNALGDMKEVAGYALMPALLALNDVIKNNAAFIESAIINVGVALGYIIEMATAVVDAMFSACSFIADNWSVIEPIVMGIVAAFTIYNGILLVHKGILLASAAVHGIVATATAIHTAFTSGWSIATFTATAAQQGLNAALLACPLTWIIGLVIALIAIIFAVANSIAKTSSVANSGFGVITGGINVVMQFFKNLGLLVADIALGITNAILALASNMGTAFHNAIAGIQSWFYDLLSTALSVVAGIAEALNKLPFVDFDFSGISNAASDYAAKSKAAAESKQEYQDVGQAFDEGMSTFDVFQDGWGDKAFKAGAKWGDGVSDKVSSTIDGFMKSNGGVDTSNMVNGGGYTAGATVPSDVSNIAKNTKKASDSLEITNEDLKYLRDIAERDVINRFTTAEIKVDMTNNNNIASSTDLDGLISDLTERATGALSMAAEGVHR